MQFQLKMTAVTVAATLVLVGSSVAQQTSTPSSKPPTSSASGSTAKPATSTAAKPKTATTASSAAPLKLTTQKEKLSYAIGMNIGQGMRNDKLDIDPAILNRAIKDAFAGSKTAMTEAEAKSVMDSFRTEMMKKKQEEAQQAAVANKAAGEKFLAQNKTAAGVVTLPSGLQYKVIKQGDGPKPTATDTVKTNYRGTLIDGTEFDSSYKRGEPVTFPVNGVIKGWTEALQLMPVGSKWQLFIPPDLAYGERSPGGAIPPNSTLVFDVELLSIEAKQDQAKPEAKPDQSKPN